MLEGHFGGWAAVRRLRVTVVGGASAADSLFNHCYTHRASSLSECKAGKKKNSLELLLASSALMSLVTEGDFRGQSWR